MQNRTRATLVVRCTAWVQRLRDFPAEAKAEPQAIEGERAAGRGDKR